MVSIDTRIRREARRQHEELRMAELSLEATKARGTQRLRELIGYELDNLVGRFKDNHLGEREDIPKWLHMKTFDQTYMDMETEGKSVRSRMRIQVLLDYTKGDSNLLLKLYGEALDDKFPIPGEFVWAPILIEGTTERGRPIKTLQYRWRRARRLQPKT